MSVPTGLCFSVAAKLYFIFNYVSIVGYVGVGTGAYGGQKRAPDTLELGLQTVVSSHVGVESQTLVLSLSYLSSPCNLLLNKYILGL